MIDNRNKTALITGVRNERSIAWAVARSLANSGATVALTHHPIVAAMANSTAMMSNARVSRLLAERFEGGAEPR